LLNDARDAAACAGGERVAFDVDARAGARAIALASDLDKGRRAARVHALEDLRHHVADGDAAVNERAAVRRLEHLPVFRAARLTARVLVLLDPRSHFRAAVPAALVSVRPAVQKVGQVLLA